MTSVLTTGDLMVAARDCLARMVTMTDIVAMPGITKPIAAYADVFRQNSISKKASQTPSIADALAVVSE